VGLVASAAAAYIHYQLLNQPGYTSFCDVSATFSCSQLYTSRYGSLGGVSVAVGGLIFFGLTALLTAAAYAAPPAAAEDIPGYLFAASTIGLAVVLYLGYASFVLLKMVCVLCVITYAAVIGLFLISGAATSIPMTSLPRRAFNDLKLLASSPLAIALTVVFLGGAASVLAFFPREGGSVVAAAPAAAGAPAAQQDQRSEFERWYTSQPRVSLIVPSEGARVVVVKFNDYQCPPCRQSHMDYKAVFAKYEASHPGQVRLVLKDFPLEAECNAGVTNGIHPAGCEAAAAVRLARAQKRAEPLEEWIFANQQGLTAAAVKQAARDVGQVKDFDAQYARVLEQVKGDTAYGGTLGVRSTPTFFINGVRIEGALPASYFDQAIAYELARAK
jgi:protein-disulfide isomerase/uncharacterized membrane protein